MAAKTLQGLFFYHGLWICRPGTGLDGLAAIYFTGYNVPIHPPVQRATGPFPPSRKSNNGQLSTQTLISQPHSPTLRNVATHSAKLSENPKS